MLEVKNEIVSTGDTEMSVHIRSPKTPELPKFQFSGDGGGALVHLIWITQPPLSESKLEVMLNPRDAILCHPH